MIPHSVTRKFSLSITTMVLVINIIVIFVFICPALADTALNNSNWLGDDGDHYWLITQPGTYFLDTDGDTFITDHSVAIRITCSDVTVDGKGKKITSNVSYPIIDDESAPNMYGVRANAGELSSNIVVKNLQIEKKHYGIIFEFVNNGVIENNSTNFNYSGIYLWKVEDNVISNNTSNNNQHTGIVFDGDQCINNNNLITENSACNNNELGILLWLECPNSTITNNLIDSNGNTGIALSAGCDYAIIQGNTSTNNPNGLYLKSSFNEVNNNTFSGNANNGIWLESSNSNNITGNTISGNQNAGIWLSYPALSNIITGNFITENRYWGIFFSNDCNNQTIYNNYFLNYGNVYLAGTNVGGTWSTPLTPGENIVGGPYLGGNYWGKPDNSGFSQTEDDNNQDGICDSENILSPSNTDSLPLHSVAPIVTTEAATSISYDSATFNGTVKSGGSSTTVTFEYGLTTDYTAEIEANANPFANFDTNAVTAAVDNLQNGSSYHYRIKASNSDGVTFGEDQTFETTTLETMYINYVDSTCNGNAPCRTSIQDGINAANTIHRIMITAGNYSEDIILDSAKKILLQGGYDESYSFQNDTTQIISLTIIKGCIILDNMSITMQ